MTLTGMNVEAILDVAAQLDRNASRIEQSMRAIDDLTRTATDAWRGPDVAQFRGRWEGQLRRSGLTAAQQLRDFADVARRNAESQRATSDTLGAGSGGFSLGGAPGLAVINVPRLLNKAWSLVDWGWGSDGMGGGRRATDEVVRAGRDLPGYNFDNDWAGRAILGRYLAGGDDWTITNDDHWTDYMTSNEALTSELGTYNDQQAQAALQEYLTSGSTSGEFATNTPMNMENGESIVGYQYLHGTNADAGGFQHSGNTKVEPVGDGTYRVTVTSDYVWNDTIDPNPQYSTDTRKNMIAEIMTFGRADPYDIHIGWSGSTTVVVDKNGKVLSGEGWPK